MTRLFLNPFTGRFFTIVARRRKPRKAPVNARVEQLRAQAKAELPPDWPSWPPSTVSTTTKFSSRIT